MDEAPIVNAILRLGRAQERLERFFESQPFDILQKEKYWESKFKNERNRLDALRLRLRGIQREMNDLYDLLHGSEDHE